MGLNVAVLANLKRNAPHDEVMPADAWDDLDSDITVNAIVGALESAGHRRCRGIGPLPPLCRAGQSLRGVAVATGCGGFGGLAFELLGTGPELLGAGQCLRIDAV